MMKIIGMKTIVLMCLFFVGGSVPAAAHCDTMAGPVVAAARQALDTGNITSILAWVRPEHESEVRTAFDRTRKLRTQSTEARELADRYFFETVVRLHRAGEGEPFTGLKQTADEPAIAAVDRALESGDASVLLRQFPPDQAEGIRPRFLRAVQTRPRADESLVAGREYVSAYVALIHFVHGLETGEAHVQHEAKSVLLTPTPIKAEIEQFMAGKTQLKKNAETKLVLAFRAEPAGARLNWRLACEGVAITGWESKQVLSITERSEGGAIQAIEGHDFIGTNPAVLITVKRHRNRAVTTAGCTAILQADGLGKKEKAIAFELR